MKAELTGDQVFQIRTRMGLSTAELAGQLGITRGAVSHWERGRGMSQDSMLALIKVATESGTDLSFLELEGG